MKRVLKWEIPVDARDHEIGGGPVVLVETSGAYVTLWTEESGEQEPAPPRRMVRVYGTGHPIPDDWMHSGSAKHDASGLVWHVYGRLPQ